MAEKDLHPLITKLRTATDYTAAAPLLSQAKLTLLKLNALTPSTTTSTIPSASSTGHANKSAPSPSTLRLAREIFEHGALLSIRATLPDVFVRYVNLLRPFYEAAEEEEEEEEETKNKVDGHGRSQRNRVIGLYLLLLLTQGDYSSFHTELEGLQMRWGSSQASRSTASRGVNGGNGKSGSGSGSGSGKGLLEDDVYLGYPIKLERWLMEGAYDLVWKAMASREVPSEEYGVFSEILTTQIRSEIASCSERAYPSLPISSAKNLLFLPSEGAVVQFANSRGWLVRDGRIVFASAGGGGGGGDGAMGEGGDEDETARSAMAIETTLGYARELETIV